MLTSPRCSCPSPVTQAIASVLCLTLAAFAFLRPHTPETRRTVLIKEGLFAFATAFYFATVVAATVVFARRSATITVAGYSAEQIALVVAASGMDLHCP